MSMCMMSIAATDRINLNSCHSREGGNLPSLKLSECGYGDPRLRVDDRS